MDFSEKLLYHIWDAQHIIKKPATISGKQVLVMYQGQWNTDFGADFRNGIINIDGEVLRGSIEIHIKTYDWIAHKHNEDANFNDTVLHVVYEHNGNIPYSISEDGRKIEILELKNCLDQDLAKLIKKFARAGNYYPELCTFFAGLEANIAKMLLLKLGTVRLERKVKRFAAELFFSDFNQLLYQGLMEAGGYSKNSYNMLQLALGYPYVELLKWKEEGVTAPALQSAFIYSSGLADKIPKNIPESLVKQWQKDAPLIDRKELNIKWNLFRVRPANHPVLRIIQLVNFVTMEDDLLGFFVNLYSTAENDKQISKKILSAFNDAQPDKMFHLGKDRLETFNINIVIPVLLLYADKVNNQLLKRRVWDCYKNHSGLGSNYVETFMKKKYLNETQQKFVRQKAVYQQGLLKLYFDYCRCHNCSLCQTHKKDLILSM